MHRSSLQQTGLTLTELIISIGILGVLIALASPSFAQFMAKSDADTAATIIYRHLSYARLMALDTGTQVTVCSTSNGQTCIPTAGDQIMVFKDDNKNKRVDRTENVYLLADRPKGKAYINWNVPRLVFRHDGSANSGSIIYCPKNNKPENIRRITVSFAGRIYVAKPGNEGIVRSASNTVINCTTPL